MTLLKSKRKWFLNHYKEIILPTLVFSVALLGFFYAPGSVFVHSDVQVNPLDNSYFEIKNTGMIQAKNIVIQIISHDEFKISEINCPEIILDNSGELFTKKHILKADRFSTNLSCVLSFDLPNNAKIESITIMSDNSPAYVWTYVEKMDTAEDAWNWLSETSGNSLLDFTSNILVIIVSLLLSAATYLFQRRIKEKELLSTYDKIVEANQYVENVVRTRFTEFEKEQVRSRQNGKCNECGSIPPIWEFHHKDNNILNNSLDNCEGLCPNCHAVKTHR